MKPNKCLLCNETLSIIFEEEYAYKVHCFNCLITFSNCALYIRSAQGKFLSGMWFNDHAHGVKVELKNADAFGTFEECCRFFKLKAFF